LGLRAALHAWCRRICQSDVDSGHRRRGVVRPHFIFIHRILTAGGGGARGVE
jgi:hypothetical protein